MSSTEEDANVSGENSVEKFLTSLITSLVVGSILLLLFLVLRGRKLSPRVLNFRHYFSPRTKYANVKHPGYYPGAFSWFWPTVTYSDWKVFRTHGPDAMIFARFQKLCILLFVVLMWTLALLLPINIAADPVDGVTGLAVLSMSNVASESSWLVAHVVVTWLNSFVVYGMITWFFFWFLRPRRRYLAQDWPRAYTMMVKSVRKGSMESDEALARWAARKFPDKHILAAHVVYTAPKLRNLLQERKDLLTQIELLHRKDQLNKTIRPKKVGKKVNAFEFFKENVRKVRGKIIERQMNPAAHMKTNHYGFITFAEPHLIYNKTMRKSGYILKPAPEPSNVFWERLSISPISFILRSIPIYIALFLLIIFWALITVIVAGFTQLESLSELDGFGWLDFINDLPPPVNGFISGFFPTLALMILALIPWMAINLLVGVVQGHDTRSTADRHKLYWYFFFLVFNILLVYTFGTAVLDTLQEIIDDPASVPELLAASLPSTAVFFLQWLVLATFIRAPLRLIRIGHFVVRSLKLMFLAKTPRKVFFFCFSFVLPLSSPFSLHFSFIQRMKGL
ncbi:phosphate metabolism protein 7 [Balamuthia mandrillaris]